MSLPASRLPSRPVVVQAAQEDASKSAKVETPTSRAELTCLVRHRSSILSSRCATYVTLLALEQSMPKLGARPPLSPREDAEGLLVLPCRYRHAVPLV